MDFFASLFTITSNAPEPESAPLTPIDAANDSTHIGCNVA
jgi:hypothetical protein